MFKPNEAKQFLENLFQVWSLGEIDKLTDFYSEGVIGHYKNSQFNFDDIKQRMRMLNRFCAQRRFEVIDNMLIEDMCVVKVRQTWLAYKTEKFCKSYLVGIYKIRDKKIIETWLMVDEEHESYCDINKLMIQYLNQFELAMDCKKEFFKYLNDYEYFHKKKPVNLTEKEQEILFYYLRGLTSKEIAIEMHISHRTVENHINNLKEKYQCHSKVALRRQLFPNGC